MKAQPMNTIGHLSPSPPLIKGAYPPLCWLQQQKLNYCLVACIRQESMRVFSLQDLCQPKVMMQLTSHSCIEEGSPAVTTTMKVDISSMSHQQSCHLTEVKGGGREGGEGEEGGREGEEGGERGGRGGKEGEEGEEGERGRRERRRRERRGEREEGGERGGRRGGGREGREEREEREEGEEGEEKSN